jgi:integrase/recombinase XerD
MSKKLSTQNKNYLKNYEGHQKALTEFKDYLENVEHCRKDTVDTYYYNLRQIFKDILKEKHPYDLNVDDIIEYQRYCGKKFSEKSLSPKYATLRRYILYIVKMKKAKKPDIRDNLPQVRGNQNKKHISKKDAITKETMDKIFKISKKENFRHYVMFNVFYEALTRRKEIINLNLDDVDYDKSRLKLTDTKTHEDRLVRISPECLEVIKVYIKDYRGTQNTGNEKALFLYEGNRVSRCKIFEQFKEYKYRLNLKSFHPHLLRHTGCTHFAQELNNSDKSEPQKLKILMEQSGHTDIKTLMRYLHLSESEIDNVFIDIYKAREKPQEPKKPEEPKIPINTNIKLEIPKVIQDVQEKQLELKVKQLELELANKNAEIKLLELREKTKKLDDTTQYYG